MLRDEGLQWLGVRRMLRDEGLQWLGVCRMLRDEGLQWLGVLRMLLDEGHPVCKNELDSESYNMTLARKNIAP